jgi:flavin-binding protein dodecin
MAYTGRGKGEPDGEGNWIGTSPQDVSDAIRAAVDAARQPSGTWFEVRNIQVESVDDPNVGTYKVTITPGG